MVEYNWDWFTEWDKPKLYLRLVWFICDIPYLVREHWILIISLFTGLYLMNRALLYQDMIMTLISIVVLMLGGIAEGRRYGSII